MRERSTDSLAWLQVGTRLTNLERDKEQMMSDITALKAKAEEALQAMRDLRAEGAAEKEQFVAYVAAQDAVNAELQAQIDALAAQGGSVQDREALAATLQATLDESTAARTEISDIVPQAEPEPEPEPEPEL